MTTKTIDNYDKEIAKLNERIAQVKKAKRLAEQRQNAKMKTLQRKIELRQKILLGAMVIEKLKSGEYDKEKITQDLDKFLTRPKDRTIFGFEPKDSTY